MNFRGIILSVLFLMGVSCFILYFRMSTDDSATSENEEVSLKPGTLLTDTVSLGKLTVLDDGTLLAGNSRGEVKIFAAGKAPQTVKVAKTSISAPVTEYNQIFYVGDEGGTFSAFTPEQGVLWTFHAGNQITGAAVPAGDLIWFGAHDNSLYAIGVSGETRGKPVHEVECQGQINGTPLIHDGYVYFGSCDGKLRKIDMLSGNVIQSLDFESYIPESPVLYDGVLYLLTHGGDFAAVSPEKLDIIFRIHSDSACFSSPFATENYIYLTDSDGKIHIHHRKDGSFVCDLPSEISWNPVSVGDENGIYVISNHGRLSYFDAKNEWKEKHIAEFPSDFKTGIIMTQDMLVAADEYGNLFYVKCKDLKP